MIASGLCLKLLSIGKYQGAGILEFVLIGDDLFAKEDLRTAESEGPQPLFSRRWLRASAALHEERYISQKHGIYTKHLDKFT